MFHAFLSVAALAFDNPWTSAINAIASVISIVINYLYSTVTHNYGWTMMLLAVIATAVMLPLYLQTFRNVKEMQAIQPYVKRLQDKFKDNRQKLAEEQMKLFREHNINPFGGCMPMLIQLPIFFAIYQAIRSLTTQFAHAGWLWIGSAFAAHLPSLPAWLPFNLGGAVLAHSLNDPDKVLTLLYAISMFFSFQMTTTVVTDPQQAASQKMMSYMMPVLWFFIGQRFASAFTLYWLTLNICSTSMRMYVMRAPSKIPAPPQETAATLAGYPLHCPNCKALLTVGKGSKCASCGAKIKKVAPASNGKVAPSTTVTPADN